MRTFSSIGQFRHVVENIQHIARYTGKQDENDKPIYDLSRPLPTITFVGHVKLHGTNAGIQLDAAGKLSAMSKEREITPDCDNHGFAERVLVQGGQDMDRLLKILKDTTPADIRDRVVQWNVYGEWVGKSINAKTAIGKLTDRWVLFNVLYTLDDGKEVWYPANHLAKAWHDAYPPSDWIFFISDYATYYAKIDFNDPGAALDQLEKWTLEVEEDCPVARAMGGDPGIGEGIVWAVYLPVYGHQWFKTKGSKHKGTKNSRLVQIDPEVMASQEAFVDAVLTESRLEQGFDLIKAEHGKVTLDHTGDFLKWIGQDVLKEESDTLAASGLTRKDVMGAIGRRAKAWLMPRLAKF